MMTSWNSLALPWVYVVEPHHTSGDNCTSVRGMFKNKLPNIIYKGRPRFIHTHIRVIPSCRLSVILLLCLVTFYFCTSMLHRWSLSWPFDCNLSEIAYRFLWTTTGHWNTSSCTTQSSLRISFSSPGRVTAGSMFQHWQHVLLMTKILTSR